MQAFIHKHLKHKTWLSYCLLPFSFLYCLIVCTRRLVYRLFPALAYRAKVRVISVGNITAGGSGKTPFVMHLAETLQANGESVAIVLRGYKSGQESKNILVTSENLLEVGDEAALYARNLPGVPIAIGKNRKRSIAILQEKYPALNTVIMDDAFQHLQVKQDVKYCVFSATYPISNGFCLPAGLLREPLSTLKYADYIVVNGENITIRFQRYKKPMIYCQYHISRIFNINQNTVDTSEFIGKKVMLLSGIGNPQSFENTVCGAGITFYKHMRLPDHFQYTLGFFKGASEQLSAFDCILTTEKDYCKIQHIATDLPIFVVCVKLKVIVYANNKIIDTVGTRLGAS